MPNLASLESSQFHTIGPHEVHACDLLKAVDRRLALLAASRIMEATCVRAAVS
jgi:hypothetical protein